jgi:hypothetical protein
MNWYQRLNSYVNTLPTRVDKALHILGGLLIVLVIPSFLIAIVVVTLVGFGKEFLDKNFNLLDALAWVVGGLLGGLIKYV